MDEPTASLDAITKESLQDLLMALHLKEPRTTLFVTHSMEEAVFLSDCVFIMDQGGFYPNIILIYPWVKIEESSVVIMNGLCP